MSTGRICPCQKIDNSQKIANESLWRNPGESQGGEMLLISAFIEKKNFFFSLKIIFEQCFNYIFLLHFVSVFQL